MAIETLRQFRMQRGLSQEEVAFEAGITGGQLSKYEAGKKSPKLNELEAFARRLGVSVPTLLGYTDSMDIPIVSWVSAGQLLGTEPVLESARIGTAQVAGLPPGNWIALQVSGDSMDRVAPDGAVICVNRQDTTLVQGKCYVFSTEDGEATFKRYLRPDRMQPYSTNPDHPSLTKTDQVGVIGRVWRVIHDLK